MTNRPDDGIQGERKSRALTLITRVANVFLACAVVLMSAQVILRFGFNAHQAWAEEVDRYLFIWSVYLGATIALMRGTHIRVLFIVDRFGPKGEMVSQWLTRVIGIAAFAFTAYYRLSAGVGEQVDRLLHHPMGRRRSCSIWPHRSD